MQWIPLEDFEKTPRRYCDDVHSCVVVEYYIWRREGPPDLRLTRFPHAGDPGSTLPDIWAIDADEPYREELYVPKIDMPTIDVPALDGAPAFDERHISELDRGKI